MFVLQYFSEGTWITLKTGEPKDWVFGSPDEAADAACEYVVGDDLLTDFRVTWVDPIGDA